MIVDMYFTIRTLKITMLTPDILLFYSVQLYELRVVDARSYETAGFTNVIGLKSLLSLAELICILLQITKLIVNNVDKLMRCNKIITNSLHVRKCNFRLIVH